MRIYPKSFFICFCLLFGFNVYVFANTTDAIKTPPAQPKVHQDALKAKTTRSNSTEKKAAPPEKMTEEKKLLDKSKQVAPKESDTSKPKAAVNDSSKNASDKQNDEEAATDDGFYDDQSFKQLPARKTQVSKNTAPKNKQKNTMRRKKSGDPIEDFMTMLRTGNKRFAIELSKRNEAIREAADENNESPDYSYEPPVGIIISDIDGLSSPQDVFDYHERNLFSIRTPGLIIDSHVIDGIHMGINAHKLKVIIVLTRNHSELFRAACEGDSPHHSSILLAKLIPAVKQAQKKLPDLGCTDPRLIEAIAKENMLNALQAIQKQLPEVKQLIQPVPTKSIDDEDEDLVEPKETAKKLQLLGALMNDVSGKVTFYDALDL